MVRTFLLDETGQDLTEYTLVVAFLLLLVVVIFSNISPIVNTVWAHANSTMSGATPTEFR